MSSSYGVVLQIRFALYFREQKPGEMLIELYKSLNLAVAALFVTLTVQRNVLLYSIYPAPQVYHQSHCALL